MSTKSTVLSTSVLLIALILLGKFAAFGKDVVISAFYGTTFQTDAYFVASSVPGLIFTAFYSTVTLVFLPIYNEKRLLAGAEVANKFASNVINVYVLFSFVLSIIGVYMAPGIIRLMAPSFNEETYLLAVDLTRIFCVSFVFSISVGILSSIQFAHKKYYGPHVIPFVNNSITMLCVIYFALDYGIYAAALAAVVGWVIQVPVQKMLTGDKLKYEFILNFNDASLRKMAWLLLPVFVGVSVDQLNILIDTVLGSALVTGSISALNYSNRLLNFSSGMFVILIATIMFPLFSDCVINDDIDRLNSTISKTIRALIIVTVPLMVIALIFHYEIVSIVFGRGLFDESSVWLTSNVFLFYSVAMIFIVLREMLNRAFYSLKDVRSPLIISLVAVSVNIMLSLVLVHYMEASGLALATSISTIVYCALQFYLLRKRIGNSFYTKLQKFIVKVILSAVVMAAAIYLFHMLVAFESALARFVFGSIVGVISYLVTLLVVRMQEIIVVEKYLVKVLGRD